MSPEPTEKEIDHELVRRTLDGDMSAYDELILKYNPKIYGMVYNMTSNREDTNDVLQDIFAKAFRSLEKFQGKSSFYTWLYAISVNMTLNFLKKRKRRASMSLDDVDTGIQNDPSFVDLGYKANPRHNNSVRELQEKLNIAMQQLSDDHRTVVTMFDIQGIPHGTISKILGISEGTVRSRLFYAHQQLQTYLSDFRD